MRSSSAFVLCLFFFAAVPSAAQDAASPQPAEVMILGTYHFANPGADAVNMEADDVLAPKQQSQIEAVVESLSRFEPTKVAVEIPLADSSRTSRIDSLYRAYVNGTHELTRNEVQQIGFRLAERFGHARVHHTDYRNAFPLDEVMSYAAKRDTAFVTYFRRWRQRMQQTVDSLQENATIPEILRSLNDPDGILADSEAMYARAAGVGDSTNYVGADFTTKWYERNLRIFANVARITEPGDRVVVLYGSGHAPMLRRLVEASPRMELVDPLRYL
jgi:hypothetical protein